MLADTDLEARAQRPAKCAGVCNKEAAKRGAGRGLLGGTGPVPVEVHALEHLLGPPVPFKFNWM